MPLVEAERGLAVEIPREHDDRAFGALGRLDERVEVGLPVDEEGDPARPRDRVAVLPDREDRFRGPPAGLLPFGFRHLPSLLRG